MRISAKGEYAIRAVLDLALQHDKDLTPIQEIAKRQDIPQRYLEQVLLLLKRAGFLTSKRGSTGGYRLLRPPGEITVGSVLRAIEGRLERPEPGKRGAAGVGFESRHDLAELWERVSAAVSEVVDRVTFEDLGKQIEARRSAARPMYHI